MNRKPPDASAVTSVARRVTQSASQRRCSFMAAICLLLLGHGSGALANTCELPPGDLRGQQTTQFHIQDDDKCLGEDADSTPIALETLQLAKQLGSARDEAFPYAQRRRLARGQLAALVAALDAQSPIAPGFEPARRHVRGTLFAIRRALATGLEIDRRPLERAGLVIGVGQEGIDLQVPLDAACREQAPDTCRSALQETITLARHAQLAGRLLSETVSPVNVDFDNKLSRINAQWKTYFEEGRSQYIWELVLNGYLYRAGACNPDDDEDEDDEYAPYPAPPSAAESRHVDGSDATLPPPTRQRGCNQFTPPPRGQVILLHPGASLEFSRPDDGGTRLRPAAVVEVLGYNRLCVAGPDCRWSLGGALVATITPDGRGGEVGWGAMVHLNRSVSFGVARRHLHDGPETTWLISGDLGRLFLAASEKARERFRLGRAR